LVKLKFYQAKLTARKAEKSLSLAEINLETQTVLNFVSIAILKSELPRV
jgi:hypothetical protein